MGQEVWLCCCAAFLALNLLTGKQVLLLVVCWLLAVGCWLLRSSVCSCNCHSGVKKTKICRPGSGPRPTFAQILRTRSKKKKKGNGPFDDGNNQCGICLGYFQ